MKLVEYGGWRFVSGYWLGMKQPVALVSLRIENSKIDSAIFQKFDDIQAVLYSSCGIEKIGAFYAVGIFEHPLLGRLIGFCLDILSKIGMPIMAGAKVEVLSSNAGSQLLQIGLPAISRDIPAPQVIFSFACELLNRLAGEATTSQETLELKITRLLAQFRRMAPAGMNTLNFLQAAHELDIPWRHVVNNVYQFGWGRQSRWLDSSFTDETSNISAKLARNKIDAAKVLRDAGLPVPEHQLVNNVEHALKLAQAFGYPVVVKPANLDGGAGVFAGVHDAEKLKTAFAAASKLSSSLLVEKFVNGNDYRVRVYKNEAMGVVLRRPPTLTGDGISSVRMLIDKINADREKSQAQSRCPGIEYGLKAITIDDEVLHWLASQQLDTESVVEEGRNVRLRGAANVSLGGTVREVDEETHPDNMDLAVQAAVALRLDVAGVDLILPDIKRSWKETGGVICEVNAQPQLSEKSIHQLLRRLLPSKGRIPIVGISGEPPEIEVCKKIVCGLKEVGRKIALATTAEQCRIELASIQNDGIIFMPRKWPSVREGMPFDCIDLHVEIGKNYHPPSMMDFNQSSERWDINNANPSQLELIDRLVNWFSQKI